MEMDAWNLGVEPGGLTSKTEIKLLICYLLKSLDAPLSKLQLSDIIQGEGLANYFELIQALDELIRDNNVKMNLEDTDEMLTVTEKGINSVEDLEMDFLPRSVKEKAVNTAIRLQTLARRERENKIEVDKLENGYNVTFFFGDEKTQLMKLTIYVADEIQVETVKKNFLEDPIKLYSEIITSLTV
ncbi:MAG: DUF4364 family protein [Clostridia bacterium]|nr:DUF4364 family protein [Clostridia bacterium]